MQENYFRRVQEKTGTSFWVNNVTLEQADLAIAAGARGCTQNPGYTWKILDGSSDSSYAKELLDEILKEEADDSEALARLQIKLIANICGKFRPMWEESKGKYGWVSIQGDPYKENVRDIVRFAHAARAAAANAIIKIPATKDGIEAMEVLASEGVPILATEVMSVAQALDVMELYERAEGNGKASKKAPFYMAHIAGIFDEHLRETVEKEGLEVDRDYLWQAGIIVAKVIDRLLLERQSEVQLLSGGARGLHHFTEMVGVRGSVTLNWQGSAEKLLEENPIVIDRFSAPVSPSMVDHLIAKIPDFHSAYVFCGLKQEEYEKFGPVVRFRNSFELGWTRCLEYIAKRRKELTGEKL